MSSCEVEFKKLYEKYSKSKKYLIPKEEYNKIFENLKTATEVSSMKSHHHAVVQYYILKEFEVLVCGNIEKLIKRRKTQDELPVYFAIMEERYDIINRGDISTDHGGRDRMANTFVKCIPTSQQKLLNFTSPTALCARRNVQEPQVLL